MLSPLSNLELRAGEIRRRLAVIGGMDELPDEVRAEMDGLRREYDTNELRQAALKIAGDTPATPIETRTSEGREYRTLTTKASVSDVYEAAFSHGPMTGATAELQQHHGLEANMVPLSLLVRSWPTDNELETRAVTPAPSNIGQNQHSIIPWVFPQSAASYVGIDMPTVDVGAAVFPVLTKQLDVRTPAENADADETTGTFSAEVLKPGRIQAAFFYSREDRAQFAGMDASLRENLSMGLSDGLDQQIIAGTDGLLNATILANHNVTAVTTFDLYMSGLVYERVDGRYANASGDIKLLVGSSTYAHAGSVYRNTSVDRTVLDRMMEVSGGVRVSAHVPAAASNRQNVLIRRGMNRDYVAPIWEGIAIIPDEITKAKQGQIVVTAIMLSAQKLLRADGFYKQQVQTS